VAQKQYVQVAFPIPVQGVFTYVVPEPLAAGATLGSHVLASLGRRKLSGFVVGVEPREDLKSVKLLEALVRPEPVFDSQMLELGRRVAEHYLSPLGEILAAAYPGHADKRPRAPEDSAPAVREVIAPFVEPVGAESDGDTGAARVFVLHLLDAGRERLYPHLVNAIVAAGGSVLFLVPEVSTSATLVGLLKARFGPNMALFHSKLRISERKKIWEDCRTGHLSVVVGTRSAVFLPLQNLKFIAVEDEHAQPYKQEETPRYNGRDVALMRAELEGIPIVLASATPSVETYLALKRNEYQLLAAGSVTEDSRETPQPAVGPRVEAPDAAQPVAVVSPEVAQPSGEAAREAAQTAEVSPEVAHPAAEWSPDVAQPDIRVVDMRNWDNVVAGAGEFSLPLASAIQRCLDEQRKVLLFLNRRGFSTYVQCQDCGRVEACPSCELPLVLHSGEGALLCHHCGYRTHAPLSCQKCNGVRFRFGGAGIEKVETQLRKLVPSARMARMDLDSARTGEDAVGAARKFAKGELDVLIGTLMVMKGFDLGEISLVGVLHAEAQLNIPDFRSGERAFELLSEVVSLVGDPAAASCHGDAGHSGPRTGPDDAMKSDLAAPAARQIVIQTLNPEHHSIRAIVTGDHGLFYEQELQQREELGYPPFSTLIAIHIFGPKEPQVLKVVKQVSSVAASVASALEKQSLWVQILGPSPAFPARSRGQFRWHMSMRSEKREAVSKAARGILAELGGKHEIGGVTVSVDVDPVGA
jgi:primosomal protein N' (replication factor Y)